VSTEQTTLWDQVQYSGAPGDFVWVLPTPAPASIEVSTTSFLDWLEHTTSPVVYPPPRAGADGSGGCGASTAAVPTFMGGTEDQVTVYHSGQVGPYDTATIGSDNPAALQTWLTDHGYAVPTSIQPIIAWYVQQKWVFSALRLMPGADVSQMVPVRVTFPGQVASFPLRMVAAGAAQPVGITLWIIADQRYAAASAQKNSADAATGYDTVTLDDSLLRWSSVTGLSNYRDVFTQTIASHGGRAFVCEYAQPFPTTIDAANAGDVAVALTGQSPSVTLTRLRTEINPALLTDDLSLLPAPSNAPVSNLHYLSTTQLTDQPVGAALSGARLPMLAMALLLLLARIRNKKNYKQ
jgi:hypothetical protein